MEKRKLFKDNGKLKLLIIVGTRPEIIRLSAVIKKCRKYFDTVLAHTGQNYDYNLNGVFFRDLELDDPEVYLNAVGNDLGETMGNIISESYKLMAEITLPGGETFVITGDIPAMWLRDSSAQVKNYLPFAAKDEQVRSLLRGVIRFFIWRREIAVKMNVCRKKQIDAL